MPSTGGMTTPDAPHALPCCPNSNCRFHRPTTDLWRVQRQGFFYRLRAPYRVQRYRCVHCGRYFSSQTFTVYYWLRRPDLLGPIFHQLLACSGYRQIARQYGISPTTVLTQAAHIGRHCLLFHQLHRPPLGLEPIAMDGFQSFEFSQYHPTWYHLVAGSDSRFVYGFTESELRRSGAMRPEQKARRAVLEAAFGRPHPRSIENDVVTLFQILAPQPLTLHLDTDDHKDYPRALRRLPHLMVQHRVTSSKKPRTNWNPLFVVNNLDLLIRHSGANHKRETIAFSKRRQSAIERLWSLLVWRNFMKGVSVLKKDSPTPAMRLGLFDRRLTFREVFARRLFPKQIGLPARWMAYYRRKISTRAISRNSRHDLTYAF